MNNNNRDYSIQQFVQLCSAEAQNNNNNNQHQNISRAPDLEYNANQRIALMNAKNKNDLYLRTTTSAANNNNNNNKLLYLAPQTRYAPPGIAIPGSEVLMSGRDNYVAERGMHVAGGGAGNNNQQQQQQRYNNNNNNNNFQQNQNQKQNQNQNNFQMNNNNNNNNNNNMAAVAPNQNQNQNQNQNFNNNRPAPIQTAFNGQNNNNNNNINSSSSTTSNTNNSNNFQQQEQELKTKLENLRNQLRSCINKIQGAEAEKRKLLMGEVDSDGDNNKNDLLFNDDDDDDFFGSSSSSLNKNNKNGNNDNGFNQAEKEREILTRLNRLRAEENTIEMNIIQARNQLRALKQQQSGSSSSNAASPLSVGPSSSSTVAGTNNGNFAFPSGVPNGNTNNNISNNNHNNNNNMMMMDNSNNNNNNMMMMMGNNLSNNNNNNNNNNDFSSSALSGSTASFGTTISSSSNNNNNSSGNLQRFDWHVFEEQQQQEQQQSKSNNNSDGNIQQQQQPQPNNNNTNNNNTNNNNNPSPTRRSEKFKNVDDNSAPEWKTEKFPWSRSLRLALKESFGLDNFRPCQLEVINATMSRRDVFCLLPTGGGKSLCYQLPAAMTDQVTICFSPLVSLICDQEDALTAFGLRGMAYTADTPQEKKQQLLREWACGNIEHKLVFITPEMFAQSNALVGLLQQLRDKNLLARFVLDEAHCLSSWGHDFREDYLKLRFLKKMFPTIPLLALTATATERVLEDIKSILGTRPLVFRGSFNRPNLHYIVQRETKGDLFSIIVKIIKDDIVDDRIPASRNNAAHPNRLVNCSGIVYCLSRKDCEELAAALTKAGINADYYHAQSSDRRSVQQKWMANKTRVICATIAFGMGINKPDVRFVIHSCMPKSLEGYYQESGRAGRDGAVSKCILLHTGNDRGRIDRLIVNSKDQQGQLLNVYRMTRFTHNKITCRRKGQLEYFSEEFSTCLHDNLRREKAVEMAKARGNVELAMKLEKLVNVKCDNCCGLKARIDAVQKQRLNNNNNISMNFIEYADFTDHARKLHDIVRFLSDCTRSSLNAIYRGTKSNISTFVKRKLDQLNARGRTHEAFGQGSSLTSDEVDAIILEMFCQEIFVEKLSEVGNGKHSVILAVLKIGRQELVQNFLAGRLRIKVPRLTVGSPVEIEKNQRRLRELEEAEKRKEERVKKQLERAEKKKLAAEKKKEKATNKNAPKPKMKAAPKANAKKQNKNTKDDDDDPLDTDDDDSDTSSSSSFDSDDDESSFIGGGDSVNGLDSEDQENIQFAQVMKASNRRDFEQQQITKMANKMLLDDVVDDIREPGVAGNATQQQRNNNRNLLLTQGGHIAEPGTAGNNTNNNFMMMMNSNNNNKTQQNPSALSTQQPAPFFTQIQTPEVKGGLRHNRATVDELVAKLRDELVTWRTDVMSRDNRSNINTILADTHLDKICLTLKTKIDKPWGSYDDIRQCLPLGVFKSYGEELISLYLAFRAQHYGDVSASVTDADKKKFLDLEKNGGGAGRKSTTKTAGLKQNALATTLNEDAAAADNNNNNEQDCLASFGMPDPSTRYVPQNQQNQNNNNNTNTTSGNGVDKMKQFFFPATSSNRTSGTTALVSQDGSTGSSSGGKGSDQHRLNEDGVLTFDNNNQKQQQQVITIDQTQQQQPGHNQINNNNKPAPISKPTRTLFMPNFQKKKLEQQHQQQQQQPEQTSNNNNNNNNNSVIINLDDDDAGGNVSGRSTTSSVVATNSNRHDDIDDILLLGTQESSLTSQVEAAAAAARKRASQNNNNSNNVVVNVDNSQEGNFMMNHRRQRDD